MSTSQEDTTLVATSRAALPHPGFAPAPGAPAPVPPHRHPALRKDLLHARCRHRPPSQLLRQALTAALFIALCCLPAKASSVAVRGLFAVDPRVLAQAPASSRDLPLNSSQTSTTPPGPRPQTPPPPSFSTTTPAPSPALESFPMNENDTISPPTLSFNPPPAPSNPGTGNLTILFSVALLGMIGLVFAVVLAGAMSVWIRTLGARGDAGPGQGAMPGGAEVPPGGAVRRPQGLDPVLIGLIPQKIFDPDEAPAPTPRGTSESINPLGAAEGAASLAMGAIDSSAERPQTAPGPTRSTWSSGGAGSLSQRLAAAVGLVPAADDAAAGSVAEAGAAIAPLPAQGQTETPAAPRNAIWGSGVGSLSQRLAAVVGLRGGTDDVGSVSVQPGGDPLASQPGSTTPAGVSRHSGATLPAERLLETAGGTLNAQEGGAAQEGATSALAVDIGKLSAAHTPGCNTSWRECPVCLCDYEAGDVIKWLPGCDHAFHAPCIDAWLLSKSTCPLCREEIQPALEALAKGGVLDIDGSGATSVDVSTVGGEGETQREVVIEYPSTNINSHGTESRRTNYRYFA